jgi:hypothetical protein
MKTTNNKITLIAGAIAACVLPAVASADFVLDTGDPTGSSVSTLSSAQFLAGEFEIGAGVTITQLSAYLTEGVGQPGDTFTFDIYSGLSGNTFLSRSSQREAPLLSVTATYTADGWNSSGVNWTAPTTGDYWLAVQVASPTNTKGLDAPNEASATTGTAPALAFAYAPSSGQYTLSVAPAIGLEVTTGSPVPLPAAFWLLGSGMLSLGGMVRRRRS